MKTKWVDTLAIYESIIAAPDQAAREAIYGEQLYGPWQQMMQMVSMGSSSDDPFAGAKAWHWLMPDQLTSPPSQMTKLQAAHAWERRVLGSQRSKFVRGSIHSCRDGPSCSQASRWTTVLN